MKSWPVLSQDAFTLYGNRLSEAVRHLISAQDLDEIFAPRVAEGFAQSFFPGFAVMRHPDASAYWFTRFSRLPSQWQLHWHSRLWLNVLGAIAVYEKPLSKFLSTEGPVSPSPQACEVIGTAIVKNWNFGLWSFAASTRAPQETFIRFDMLALNCCFIIETVESRVAGRPGWWHLIEEVLHVLDAQGTQLGIPWIHTLATSDASVSIFQRYDFMEIASDVAFFSPKAKLLRRRVRPPSRAFGSPPSDLQHLFPSP